MPPRGLWRQWHLCSIAPKFLLMVRLHSITNTRSALDSIESIAPRNPLVQPVQAKNQSSVKNVALPCPFCFLGSFPVYETAN